MPQLKRKWRVQPITEIKPVKPAPPSPEPAYFTLKNAAKYLGVPSVWTIRGLITKGLLVAKRIGKYDMVRKTDLDAVWEQQATSKKADERAAA